MQPTFFICHGAGPCFFAKMPIGGPPGTWDGLERFLRGLPERLPERPRALLVVSSHWKTHGFAVTSSARPAQAREFPAALIREDISLDWSPPGDPTLAGRVAGLLAAAGLPCSTDPDQELDHAVWVPGLLAFPDADVPVVALSIDADMDAAQHVALGRALRPLREEGVVIVGSGSSFHNMELRGPDAGERIRMFDRWLEETVTSDAPTRDARLARWDTAPAARDCHAEESHLIPLMVAAGAAETGQVVYQEDLANGIRMSGYRFD